jgi:hypothetical protein
MLANERANESYIALGDDSVPVAERRFHGQQRSSLAGGT